MKIAIVGAGRIGSVYAFHLARAKHDVTVIARGKRLEELQTGIIESVDGERATVSSAPSLDPTVAWDVVLVTVLAHQVDGVLPQLAASRAKSVLFLFNTFDKLDRLREAVGAERFVFGFPTMTAAFVDGKLKSTVKGTGMSTTMSSDRWVGLLKEAGLPVAVEADMESFLRSHAAFVIPLMVAGLKGYARQGGVTWAEARELTRAMKEAFVVVKQLGNKVVPRLVATMSGLPSFMLTSLIWSMSRSAAFREVGSFGPGEVRELIDAVIKASPVPTPVLAAIRP